MNKAMKFNEKTKNNTLTDTQMNIPSHIHTHTYGAPNIF